MSPTQLSARALFAADRARYPRAAWLYERSLWAIAAYRLAQAVDSRAGGIDKLRQPRGALVRGACALVSVLVQVCTGIELPLHARIGPGLRIYHAGNVIVNPGVTIGRDCTLRPGVTLGNLDPEGPVPTVGDCVEFGVYAQVLGGVSIGDGAKIGAMALVLQDVPAGATAVGVPARVIPAPR